MDINKDNLLAANYKSFDSSFEAQRYPEYYLESFQKRFDDDRGKKYYITLHALKDLKPDRTIFAVDCQFNVPHGDQELTFNAELLLRKNPDYPPLTQIEEMEEFYENLWQRLNCKHYERFNEGDE